MVLATVSTQASRGLCSLATSNTKCFDDVTTHNDFPILLISLFCHTHFHCCNSPTYYQPRHRRRLAPLPRYCYILARPRAPLRDLTALAVLTPQLCDCIITARPLSATMPETTKVVPLTCHGHSRPVPHIHFSSLMNDDQYYIISACKDGNPMLRDGITGDWIGTFLGHKGAVWQARLSSDASLAASASADFSAYVSSLPYKSYI